MKYLDNNEVMSGDPVIVSVDNGKAVIVGNVHQLYERTNQLRVTGYALNVSAADCVLAQKCYDAYAAPFLKARAEAAAKAKGEAEKPAEAPPGPETPTA